MFMVLGEFHTSSCCDTSLRSPAVGKPTSLSLKALRMLEKADSHLPTSTKVQIKSLDVIGSVYSPS